MTESAQINQEIIRHILGMAVTVFALVASHYYVKYRGDTASRIERYITGCVCIWLGYATAQVLVNDWTTPITLLLIIVPGGLIVMAAYKYDAELSDAKKGRKAERNDPVLNDGE